ncbi:MAG: heat-inducible transcription repressor HrcA [Elusimicrobia bacterium RIFOXYB2_FULL_49_7]|nr:MAG: heat-inducible transcription repressor HrcA [Elusimicrobia bacterium RIFOXYB2_FULL_49_7]
MEKVLSEREESVLSAIVQDYVTAAEPAGSRLISKSSGLMLSPATIRNVVADLEEKGMVSQPHPSAGRIPTDVGYRYYVDHLIRLFELSNQEKGLLEEKLDHIVGSFEEVAAMASKVLSSMSRELGVILTPRLGQGIFRRLNILEISGKRIMLVLTIESGLINSIMVEAESVHPPEELQAAANFINERLGGRKIAEIELKLKEMIYSEDEKTLGIVRLFLNNARDLFTFPEARSLFADGASQLLIQPEFSDKQRIEAIIELIENKKMLIHLLDSRECRDGIWVTIGGENEAGEFKSYSLVTSSYRVNEDKGTLGVLGPTRMAYPKLISVVDYTAKILTRKFSGKEGL